MKKWFNAERPQEIFVRENLKKYLLLGIKVSEHQGVFCRHMQRKIPRSSWPTYNVSISKNSF